jgi:hypothetical protein
VFILNRRVYKYSFIFFNSVKKFINHIYHKGVTVKELVKNICKTNDKIKKIPELSVFNILTTLIKK